jgi:hypothetical protein
MFGRRPVMFREGLRQPMQADNRHIEIFVLGDLG